MTRRLPARRKAEPNDVERHRFQVTAFERAIAKMKRFGGQHLERAWPDPTLSCPGCAGCYCLPSNNVPENASRHKPPRSSFPTSTSWTHSRSSAAGLPCRAKKSHQARGPRKRCRNSVCGPSIARWPRPLLAYRGRSAAPSDTKDFRKIAPCSRP